MRAMRWLLVPVLAALLSGCLGADRRTAPDELAGWLRADPAVASAEVRHREWMMDTRSSPRDGVGTAQLRSGADLPEFASRLQAYLAEHRSDWQRVALVVTEQSGHGVELGLDSAVNQRRIDALTRWRTDRRVESLVLETEKSSVRLRRGADLLPLAGQLLQDPVVREARRGSERPGTLALEGPEQVASFLVDAEPERLSPLLAALRPFRPARIEIEAVLAERPRVKVLLGSADLPGAARAASANSTPAEVTLEHDGLTVVGADATTLAGVDLARRARQLPGVRGVRLTRDGLYLTLAPERFAEAGQRIATDPDAGRIVRVELAHDRNLVNLPPAQLERPAAVAQLLLADASRPELRWTEREVTLILSDPDLAGWRRMARVLREHPGQGEQTYSVVNRADGGSVQFTSTSSGRANPTAPPRGQGQAILDIWDCTAG
ncbi:hypothetical protein HJ590_17540 [Naumannella sp. ID2617S]|nr:hypothetical protein [Naumannella sp. ID2617S]